MRQGVHTASIKKKELNYSEGGPLKLEKSCSTKYPVTSLLRKRDITGDILTFSKTEALVKVLSK